MTQEGRRLALVIASNKFVDKTFQQLVAPSEDAKSLSRVLADPMIGHFEVKTLLNKPHYKVRVEIETFLTNCKKEDLVLLYFSGHGVKDDDGSLYLVMKDTKRPLWLSTSIPTDFVNELMNRCRSQSQVLILDCCHSGAFAQGMIVKGGESVDLREKFKGRGRVVLTSSNSIQYSFQGDQIIGEPIRSVFTHHLVHGLETFEADKNDDNLISLDELYDYIYDRVTEETTKQTPQKWEFEVHGQIVLAYRPRPIIKPYVKLDLPTLGEDSWELLVSRIAGAQCTPIIGPGVSEGVLPSASEIAQIWQREYPYVPEDSKDLAQVAQSISGQTGSLFAKEKMVKLLDKYNPPDFSIPDEPHYGLASLPFSTYITTNYDDFMMQALSIVHKNPKRELCRWTEALKLQNSILDGQNFDPHPTEPLVFHLYGHKQRPESLVLLEDDYVDFLVGFSKNPMAFPSFIARCLAGTSLLFIGFSFREKSFRELLRFTSSFTGRNLVQHHWFTFGSDSVEYIDQMLSTLGSHVGVYWGTAREFVAELNHRWMDWNVR